MDVVELAHRLRHAAEHRIPADPLDTEALDLDLAYAVAASSRELAIAAGDSVIGYKIGLTSETARAAFRAAEPAAGHLLASRWIASGERLDTRELFQPSAEVEIAFKMGAALGDADTTGADVLAATAAVAPALEIVDSRWHGGARNLPMLIADNTNAAHAVIGDTAPLPDQLSSVQSVLTIRNRTVTGTATAVLGDPAEAVAWLVRHLARTGSGLAAGDVVLSGTLSAPEPIRPGDHLHAVVTGVGEVTGYLA